jgi:hypothetical protein
LSSEPYISDLSDAALGVAEAKARCAVGRRLAPLERSRIPRRKSRGAKDEGAKFGAAAPLSRSCQCAAEIGRAMTDVNKCVRTAPHRDSVDRELFRNIKQVNKNRILQILKFVPTL